MITSRHKSKLLCASGHRYVHRTHVNDMKYGELVVRTCIYIFMRNKFMRFDKMQDYVRYVKCMNYACLSCILFACELTKLYAYSHSFPSLIVSPS